MQSDKPKYQPGSITQSQLEEIKRKVEQTNVFPVALQRAGYNKLDEITYVKAGNEKIRIYYKDDKWQYQNLKNLSDKGSLFDFLHKRNRKSIKANDLQKQKWESDFSAIAALDLYNIHLKEEKKKVSLTIAQELDKKMKAAAENTRQSINKNLGL